MKLIVAALVVIASCLLFTAGSLGQETSTPLPIDVDNIENARFFFFNSDPCNNAIYRFLNISDAKCSLQCYIQGGLQQGGYCDENNACQCNQIAR